MEPRGSQMYSQDSIMKFWLEPEDSSHIDTNLWNTAQFLWHSWSILENQVQVELWLALKIQLYQVCQHPWLQLQPHICPYHSFYQQSLLAMVGPGVEKTSQLVTGGSDMFRLIICVLDLKPSFIFLRIHKAIQLQKKKKML